MTVPGDARRPIVGAQAATRARRLTGHCERGFLAERKTEVDFPLTLVRLFIVLMSQTLHHRSMQRVSAYVAGNSES